MYKMDKKQYLHEVGQNLADLFYNQKNINMKHTAVEWLIGRFHYEGFIGTYCSEEQIKSKRQIMIEIIEQAKEMEKNQIKNAWLNSLTKGDFNSADEYYNQTYKSEQ